MGNFPAMADKNVLYKAKLGSINWSTLRASAGEEKVAGIAEAKALVELARADKKVSGAAPYAKVGAVKGKLVFRIKSKLGNYGDKDIVLVKKWKDVNKDVTLTALLNPDANGEMLTRAWWDATRGNAPDTDRLGDVLDQYQDAVAAHKQAKTNDSLDLVRQVLLNVETAILSTTARFTDKGDKAVLKKLAASVENAVAAYESKSDAIEDAPNRNLKVGLAKAKKEIEEQFKGVAASKFTDCKLQVAKVTTLNNIQQAVQQLNKASQGIAALENFSDDYFWVNFIKRQCTNNNIPTDSIAYDDYKSRVKKFKKTLVTRKKEYVLAVAHVDGLEAQLDDVEGQASDQDPNYVANLKILAKDYKDILDGVRAQLPKAQKVIRRSKELLTLLDGDADAALDAAKKVFAGMTKIMDVIEDVMEPGRTKTLVNKKDQLQINDEDYSKLCIPHWWNAARENRIISEGFIRAKRNIRTVCETFPNHNDSAGLIQSLVRLDSDDSDSSEDG